MAEDEANGFNVVVKIVVKIVVNIVPRWYFFFWAWERMNHMVSS